MAAGDLKAESDASALGEARRMRVLALVRSPTQWQAPLFRYLHQQPDVSLEVAYWSTAVSTDSELGRAPGWAPDILDGYIHREDIPASGFTLLTRLQRMATRDQMDLVLVPGWAGRTGKQILLAIGLSSALARRTIIYSDQNYLSDSGDRRRRALQLTLRAARFRGVRFGVPGSLARAYLCDIGIPTDAIFTLPYVVDSEAFSRATNQQYRLERRNQLQVPRDSVVFLAVAKMVPRESPRYVLQAFLDIAGDFPRSHLILVGDGRERQHLQALAEPVRDRVHFAGYVPYRELPQYYAAADVFIHAPRREPWGLSINEALASGLPILSTTSVGAAVDFVRNGRNGYLLDSGRAVDLSAGMRRLLACSAGELEQMGCHSLELSSSVDFRCWHSELLNTRTRSERDSF